MKIVLVTAPQQIAGQIAEALVAERHAACVTRVEGLRSVYRWKDAVQHAEEVMLEIKTSDGAVDRLVARVRQLHPYEVPQIVAFDAAWVLPEYERWVRESTSMHVPQKNDASAADERVGTGASPDPVRTMPRRGRTQMAAKKAKKGAKKAKKAGKKKK